ncbi:MAG: DUF2194 domain-containing protein [Candidatus Omnitrophica bacterium]|nr:DUF2194 domain-containing protein [Candidatus Omnitrophota bacterium]
MDILLRDDDINYFTTPEELQDAWGWYFNQKGAKLNFAIIPFVSPVEFCKTGTNEETIGKNSRLVDYLKERIKENKVEIILHGYSHASSGKRFEFESNNSQELSEKIKKGKAYLEELFGIKINSFVPPHNAISAAGLKEVSRNNLNLLAAVPLNPLKVGFSFKKQSAYLKRLIFSITHKKILKGKFIYPNLQILHNIQQLDCFNFLPELFTPQELFNFIKCVKEAKGIFCLSVHYWQLNESARSKLEETFKLIQSLKDTRFCFASEIFKVRA